MATKLTEDDSDGTEPLSDQQLWILSEGAPPDVETCLKEIYRLRACLEERTQQHAVQLANALAQMRKHDSAAAEIERLRGIIAKYLHYRRCHDCGDIAYHVDNVIPYLTCTKCSSSETRRIKAGENSDGRDSQFG